jgi:predicted nuclease of predicted toxin-antitoxin system
VKFLIDECLSAALVRLARERGCHASTHVRWIGKAGWPDHRLMSVILAEDWTSVTRNSADFRGPASAPGSKGHYAWVEVHAGLVCLNGPVGTHRATQLKLFAAVFDKVEELPDPINQVAEATLDADARQVEMVRYDLPP